MKILFLLLSLTAHAEQAATLATEVYECELTLAVSDLPEGGASWKFEAVEGGSHGGDPKVFTAGEHKVEILANRQWLGVSWAKAAQTVAESVFVIGADDKASTRAAIIYDPSGSGDQASLSCGLKAQ